MLTSASYQAWEHPRVYETGSLLDEAGPAVAAVLRQLGRRRVFRRGSSLLVQEQRLSSLFLLLDGRVKVCFRVDDGREIMFDILGPGHLIGVQEMLDGQPAGATVTAVDDVEVRVVDVRQFHDHLRAEPEIAELLLRVLAGWLRRAVEDRAALATNDAAGRVALRLVQLAQRYGEPLDGRVRILLPISQAELAAWTALSREATSKALYLLRQKKVIQTKRREIHILSKDALLRRINGSHSLSLLRD